MECEPATQITLLNNALFCLPIASTPVILEFLCFGVKPAFLKRLRDESYSVAPIFNYHPFTLCLAEAEDR
jgi:hypothetical protein